MLKSSERIINVLDYSELGSLVELADYLGVNKQNLYDIRKGRCGISKRLIEIIKNKFPNINTEWLRSGYGVMLNEPEMAVAPRITANASNNASNKITIGSHNRVSAAESAEPEQPSIPSNMVPIIPTSARAGVMGDYSDGVTLSQCEMISSPMGGATCAIRIYGDSMEPKFPSGALAFLRKVDPTIYIEWGRTYVLDTPNGAVMKCIEQADEPDKVTCVSLNEKYKSYDVPMTGILGWYRVLGAIIFD